MISCVPVLSNIGTNLLVVIIPPRPSGYLGRLHFGCFFKNILFGEIARRLCYFGFILYQAANFYLIIYIYSFFNLQFFSSLSRLRSSYAAASLRFSH